MRAFSLTGKIVKWIIRGIGTLMFLMLVAGAITFFSQPGTPPSAEQAKWAIQTYSNDSMRVPARIYLAEDLQFKDDGTPVISGYWTFDGKNFRKQSGTKEFPEDLYGSIDFKRRSVEQTTN